MVELLKKLVFGGKLLIDVVELLDFVVSVVCNGFVLV